MTKLKKMIYIQAMFVCVVNAVQSFEKIYDVKHDVHVTILNRSTSYIMNLECYSPISTFACGAEFLVNNITVDEIRYIDNLCYDTKGLCVQNVCNCTEACNNFTLNFEVAKLPDSFSFGCMVELTDVERSIVTELFNKTGIYHHEKSRHSQPPVLHNQTERPNDNTFNKEKSDENDLLQHLETCANWIGFTVAEFVLLIGLIVTTYVLIRQKRFKDSRAKQRLFKPNLKSEWAPSKGLFQPLKTEDATFKQSMFQPLQKTDQVIWTPQQTPELIPLLQSERRNLNQKEHVCHNCQLSTTSAICTDCENKYCDICCDAHTKYFVDHDVCQIQLMFRFQPEKKCKICKKKIATHICFECNKIICKSCLKAHLSEQAMLFTLNAPEVRHVISISPFGEPLKYENEIVLSRDSITNPIRVCGLAVLDNGSLAVADTKNKMIYVFPTSNCIKKNRLELEPQNIVGIAENKIAITFGHHKKFYIYSVLNGHLNFLSSIDIRDHKPFAVAYDKMHFAVEVYEGDEGMICITDFDRVVKKIPNTNMYAHFNCNSICLALDITNSKIFISSLNKESFDCLDFDGNKLWAVPMPSPRGIVIVEGIFSTSLILASQSSVLYIINTSDGTEDIFLDTRKMTCPGYIVYNEKTQLLSIQSDEQEMKVLTYQVDANKLQFY